MRWLHISNIHDDPANENFDTGLLLSKLDEFIDDERIAVDEIFYTGDFRYAQKRENPSENTAPEILAGQAAQKLTDIARRAGTDAPHIHIVPGNHDLDRGDGALLEQAYKLYAHGEFREKINHEGKLITCADYLWNRFGFFLLVAGELKNRVWLEPPANDRLRYHRLSTINNMYNVLYLNTALASGRSGERTSLAVGYEYINQAFREITNRLPTVVLGHHGLNCFTRAEREAVKELFKRNNVRLYLCGDEHVGGLDNFDNTLQLTAGLP